MQPNERIGFGTQVYTLDVTNTMTFQNSGKVLTDKNKSVRKECRRMSFCGDLLYC